MSLQDLDEEEERAPRKKRSHRLKIPNAVKLGAVILVIGMVLGAVGYAYLEPVLDGAESEALRDCLATKDLLSKENQCLYNYVEDTESLAENCPS